MQTAITRRWAPLHHWETKQPRKTKPLGETKGVTHEKGLICQDDKTTTEIQPLNKTPKMGAAKTHGRCNR